MIIDNDKKIDSLKNENDLYTFQKPRIALINLPARQNQFWELGFDTATGKKISWQETTINQIKRINQKRKKSHRNYWDINDIDNKLLNDFSIDYIAFELDKNQSCDYILKSLSKAKNIKLNKIKNKFPFLLSKNFKGFNSDICLVKNQNEFPVIRVYDLTKKDNLLQNYSLIKLKINTPPPLKNKVPLFLYQKDGIKFNNPNFKKNRSLFVLSSEYIKTYRAYCLNKNKKLELNGLSNLDYFGFYIDVPSSCKSIKLKIN